MNIISPLICTYDRKTRHYSPPMVVPTSDAAVRGFRDAVNSSARDSDLSNHPEDFTLYEIGSFNSSTGVITVYDEPQIIYEGFNCTTQPVLPLKG